ncbi:MAG: hypothetical protein V3G42_08635 [Oscillospiraceae bacterium]
MKATLNIIKKYWTMIWMVTAALLTIGAFIVIADYTGVHSVKRVVTTSASPHDLFSSNCLLSKNDPEPKKITSSQYTITICNFEQNQPTFANPEDIPYTLTAYLMVNTENGYVKMSELDSSSETYTNALAKLNGRTYSIQQVQDNSGTIVSGEVKAFSATNLSYSYDADNTQTNEKDGLVLKSNPQGTKSSTDKFLITLDAKEIEENKTSPDFAIEVVATTGTFGTIHRTVYASSSVADPVTWTGSLLENDCSTVDYDFYNYILTGSGIGTIDIMWDPTRFEINPFFFSATAGYEFEENNGNVIYACEKHSNWSQCTLRVNSTEKNRYELQLYKCMSGVPYTGTDENIADAASDFIDYKFHEEISVSQAEQAAEP